MPVRNTPEAKLEIRIRLQGTGIYIIPPVSSGTPGVFYKYFYNYKNAHRLRLEKPLYLELSRSSNGFF
jgi:hypothetical protein